MTGQTMYRPIPLTLVPGIAYGEAAGRPLLLDLVCPQAVATPRPAVIYVHGGGWFAGTRTDGLADWCCPLLAAHGFVAASIDYRLSGEATFPAQIDDVKAAIRWLRANAAAYQIDPARIGIWGFSAGGQLAALAGLAGDRADLEADSGSAEHSSRVQAVAVGSAPTDFLRPGGELRNDIESPVTRLFGGTVVERGDLMRLASPVTHVARAGRAAPPFLIAHGTRDETVPFEQAERLHAALVAAGVEAALVPIEGGYHNWSTRLEAFPGGNAPYRAFGPLAASFFRRHLRP